VVGAVLLTAPIWECATRVEVYTLSTFGVAWAFAHAASMAWGARALGEPRARARPRARAHRERQRVSRRARSAGARAARGARDRASPRSTRGADHARPRTRRARGRPRRPPLSLRAARRRAHGRRRVGRADRRGEPLGVLRRRGLRAQPGHHARRDARPPRAVDRVVGADASARGARGRGRSPTRSGAASAASVARHRSS
jgi:hypothetical protein